MKKLALLIGSVLFVLLGFSQEKSPEKKEVKKNVEVNVTDGKKEVVIEETKDGKTTKKILKGKEAEEYLQNRHDGMQFMFLGEDGMGEDVEIHIQQELDAIDFEKILKDANVPEDQLDEILKEVEQELENAKVELKGAEEDLQKSRVMKFEWKDDQNPDHPHKKVYKYKYHCDEGEGMHSKQVQKYVMPGKDVSQERIDNLLEKIEAKLHENQNQTIIIQRIPEKTLEDFTEEQTIETSNQEMANSDKTKLQVYPNPSKDVFSINYQSTSKKPVEVEVLTLDGKSVFKQKFKGNINDKIDLSSQPSGTYLLKIKDGNNELIEKIIVE